MKILLLGANGQLGRTFLDIGPHAADHDWIPASRDGALASGGQGVAADLAEPPALPAVLDRVRPDIIINAAAYTAVDQAEKQEALATRINGEALGTIGRWAAAHSALVLHYSTDYVFAGAQAEPYLPDATTGPLSAYGRSKLAGERALRASSACHLILRTGWVYAARGSNFLRTMLRLGAEREELRVVADQHGAPTDTTLIVEASLAALRSWQRADTPTRARLVGTHHVVASGVTTWHGFATAIFAGAKELGLLPRVPRVIPITSAEFPTAAQRPPWSVLDNAGFQRQFGFPLPDWRQRLHSVLCDMRDTRTSR